MSERLVLVEGSVWPEFAEAVGGLAGTWDAPSGRRYRLELSGRRLEVWCADPIASAEQVDTDLFALAAEVYDRVGGEWSADALRVTAAAWGWAPEGA